MTENVGLENSLQSKDVFLSRFEHKRRSMTIQLQWMSEEFEMVNREFQVKLDGVNYPNNSYTTGENGIEFDDDLLDYHFRWSIWNRDEKTWERMDNLPQHQSAQLAELAKGLDDSYDRVIGRELAENSRKVRDAQAQVLIREIALLEPVRIENSLDLYDAKSLQAMREQCLKIYKSLHKVDFESRFYQDLISQMEQNSPNLYIEGYPVVSDENGNHCLVFQQDTQGEDKHGRAWKSPSEMMSAKDQDAVIALAEELGFDVLTFRHDDFGIHFQRYLTGIVIGQNMEPKKLADRGSRIIKSLNLPKRSKEDRPIHNREYGDISLVR